MKKVLLEISQKFTGKHLSLGLFLNKVAALRPITLLKSRLRHRCFAVNFAKFLRKPFFKEHLQWQLLKELRSSDELQIKKKILGKEK